MRDKLTEKAWLETSNMSKRDTEQKTKSMRNRPRPATRGNSESQQVKKSLWETEECFRALLENSYDAMVILDADATVRYQSPSCERVLGYKLEDRVGSNAFEFIHPDDIPNITESFAHLMQDPNAIVHAEVRYLRKDGEWRRIEATAQNLLSNPAAKGIIINFHEITECKRAEEALQKAHDELEMRVNERTSELAKTNEELRIEITERKRVKDALRESEELHRLIISNISDAVFITDDTGEFTYICPNVDVIFGYSLPEVQALDNIAKLLGDDLLARNQLETLGEIPNIEWEITDKAGRGHVLLVNVKRVSVKGGTTLYTCRDITERKQSEKELLLKENALENSISAIVMSDMEGNITYVNKACVKLWGRGTKEELLGKSYWVMVNVDDLEIIKDVVRAMIKNQSWEGEMATTGHDGTKKHFHMLSSIVSNAEGNPIQTISFLIDITERKWAEEELLLKENALENSISAIAMSDMSGKITYANKACMKLWGNARKEDLLGKPYWILVNPDDAAVVTDIAQSMVEKGFWQGEIAATSANGEEKYMQVAAGLVKDEQGNPIHTISSFIDITERKRAEDALRQSEEKFRRFVEEMNDGYCVLQGLTIVFANARIADMFGYSQEEVIGKSIKELLSPETVDELVEVHARRQRGEMVPTQYETTLVGKDRTARPVEFSTRMIDYGGKPALSVVIRDVSERKRAEEDKQQMEQQLLLTGRLAAVGELAAGVAHELNNPLAAVQAYAQFIAARDDLEETLKSDVETIYKEAQRAARITSNLLSFARSYKPEKSFISINETIEKCLELHEYRLKVNNIEVSMELDQNLPMTMADDHQMQQVFVNLITNAEQAMTEAYSKGKLSIKTQRVGNMIQTTFADDGPGMPEDNLKRIFDPFFTTKDVGKGTGLGLSICFGIVQEHSGHLYARSKPGQGTTFVVEIPIVSEEQAVAEQTDSIQAQIAKDDVNQNRVS